MGLDQFLPSSGLAVYHCDILGSNELQEGSSTRHYQCALVQSDGRLDLERNMNQGDGGDLFVAVAGTAVAHNTVPSSRQWDGSDSGLVLSAIGAPGTKIPFTVGPVASGRRVQVDASPALAIPDDDAQGITHSLHVTEGGRLSALEVALDITHSYIGDLEVSLSAVDGTTAVLHQRAGGSADNLIRTYGWADTPSLQAFAGKVVTGEWKLSVRDVAGRDVGKLNRWGIALFLPAAEASLQAEVEPALPIPDDAAVGVGSELQLAHPGTVGRITVEVAITHTYVGDLRVELISPKGTRAILHQRLGGGQDDLRAQYDSAAPGSALQPLRGQPIEGAWVLRVADLAGQDKGRLDRWKIAVEPA
jgi:subtilisin-like proprotein convertase family protein